MEDAWLFYSWLCLLLLDASIGCVSHSFQNVYFFSIIVFDHFVVDF